MERWGETKGGTKEHGDGDWTKDLSDAMQSSGTDREVVGRTVDQSLDPIL